MNVSPVLLIQAVGVCNARITRISHDDKRQLQSLTQSLQGFDQTQLPVSPFQATACRHCAALTLTADCLGYRTNHVCQLIHAIRLK